MRRTSLLLSLLTFDIAIAFADAPRGTYSLTSDGVVTSPATYLGKELPSCGDDASAILKARTSIVLVYASDDKAAVNDETWNVVKVDKSVFVREPERNELTLRAQRSGGRASGTLVFMRFVPDTVGNKPVCISAMYFTGSFKK